MSGARRGQSRGFAEPGFAADVVAALGRARKRLEAKYFYDREGSRLFGRICEVEDRTPDKLPQKPYPTRRRGTTREQAR